jgi:hypothetical protein
MGKVEYHVYVEGLEPSLGLLQPGQNLIGTAVWPQSLHLLQQVVFQALYPDRQTIHTDLLQALQDRFAQVVGVGLDRDSVDLEQPPGQSQKLDELLGHDRGGTAPDIDLGKIVSRPMIETQLPVQGLKIGQGPTLLESDPMKGAVGT